MGMGGTHNWPLCRKKAKERERGDPKRTDFAHPQAKGQDGERGQVCTILKQQQ